MVTENFGKKFGINYLFLDPEYLGQVSFLSFFINGVGLGAFVVSYNIASYITHGKEFPFLGGLRKPFLKFSLNNAIIPFVFVCVYVYWVVSFQQQSEYLSNKAIFKCASGLVLGVLTFVFLSFTYFFNTNKDIMKMLGVKVQRKVKRAFVFQRKVLDKQFNWQSGNPSQGEIPVKHYLETNFKLEPVSFATSYDFKVLQSVLRQNHQNAVFIQLAVLLLLLLMGLLREMPFFQVPAGASIFVLFSMLVMLSGAFTFWLKGWGITVFVALMLLYNGLSKKDMFNYKNEAYGLNYEVEPAPYNLNSVGAINSDSLYLTDYQHGIRILNNWKKKAVSANPFRKPKMVIVHSSGGGQRAALFTLNTLQHVDSMLGGRVHKNAALFSGASGGAISLAVFRELILKKQTAAGVNLYDSIYKQQISKDLLNPIAFTIVVNDLFFPFKRLKLGTIIIEKIGPSLLKTA